MPRHDRAWRATGLALFVGAGAVATATGGHGVLCFSLAMAGVVLMSQGARVPLVWRIERSRHRALPQAIHERQLAHRADAARARRSRHDPDGGMF